jgi:hypothetical protein
MCPSLTLAEDLELRQAQLQAKQLLTDDPERVTALLFGLMRAHVHQHQMLDGALARVIELKAKLALAEHVARAEANAVRRS